MENFAQHSDSSPSQLPNKEETQKPFFQIMRQSVASYMAKAAGTLHQQAGKSPSPEFTKFGYQTATWLEKSADYVQHVEPQQIRADLENQVRRNPAKSLLIAGATGLVLGAIFRRRR